MSHRRAVEPCTGTKMSTQEEGHCFHPQLMFGWRNTGESDSVNGSDDVVVPDHRALTGDLDSGAAEEMDEQLGSVVGMDDDGCGAQLCDLTNERCKAVRSGRVNDRLVSLRVGVRPQSCHQRCGKGFGKTGQTATSDLSVEASAQQRRRWRSASNAGQNASMAELTQMIERELQGIGMIGDDRVGHEQRMFPAHFPTG